MANSVDPDQMPHSAASVLGLHCLLRPVCPNTYGKYDTVQVHKDIAVFESPLGRKYMPGLMLAGHTRT